jgi:hypothetical protein
MFRDVSVVNIKIYLHPGKVPEKLKTEDHGPVRNVKYYGTIPYTYTRYRFYT